MRVVCSNRFAGDVAIPAFLNSEVNTAVNLLIPVLSGGKRSNKMRTRFIRSARVRGCKLVEATAGWCLSITSFGLKGPSLVYRHLLALFPTVNAYFLALMKIRVYSYSIRDGLPSSSRPTSSVSAARARSSGDKTMEPIGVGDMRAI